MSHPESFPPGSTEQLLADLVSAIFQPIPDYPGADTFWLRIVFTEAHRAKEHLRCLNPSSR